MNRKFFFFDIDGTLTDHNPGGKVLPSTMLALEKLKAKGHVVSVATGRAEWMARDFAREHGFMNMVTDGGNGLTVDGKLIYIKPLAHDLVLNLIHECIKKNIGFCIVKDNTPIRYAHNDLMHFADEKRNQFLNIKVVEDLDYDQIDTIFKVIVRVEPGEEAKLESLKYLGYSRYEQEYIWVEPDDKTQGIKDMVSYMGGHYEDVVVFGDGRNDVKMIKAAPLGIAMGNAIDMVKEVADYVTTRNDEDGIYHACVHFGWIDEDE